MTLSSTTSKTAMFTGPGTGPYPFTFKVFSEADLDVVVEAADGSVSTLTLTADYTVILNSDQNNSPGGAVSLESGAALQAGEGLMILRVLDALQETDIQNMGGFYPEVIEDALDRLCMLVQQHQEVLDRSLKVGPTSDIVPEDLLSIVASGGAGFIWKGAWATGANYGLNNLVYEAGSTYICLEIHVSGDFATDAAAGKWSVIAQKGESGTGGGDMYKADNLAGLANAATARANLSAAKSGVNYDITKLEGLTVGLQVNQGGTGALTENLALNNLTASAFATTGQVLTRRWDGYAVFMDPPSGTGGDPNNETTFAGTADFVLGPGSTKVSGTDNSAVMDAALADGDPIYVPAGDYWIGSAGTRYNMQFADIYGPGVFWGNTNVGYTKLGKTLPVGTNRSHELGSVGGLHIGGEDGGFGMRQWMGHHNWMQFQPMRYGAPCQVQLYPSVWGCTATPQSPDRLNAVYGSFDASELFVGDYIGWNGGLYVVATFPSAAYITVVKAFVGGSPGWATDGTLEKPCFKAYETSEGLCNTNGTAVTYVSGEQFPYGYSGDHMYAVINGTKYTVTAGPESGTANALTLASSAGTQTGVSIKFYRQYAPWSYVSLLRLQGIAGGKESVGVLSLNTRNEVLLAAAATSATLVGNMRIEAPRIRFGYGEAYPWDGSTSLYCAEFVYPASGSAYAALGGFNGSESFRANVGASVINRLEAIGGATGYATVLAARGGDATINLGFDLKGYGYFAFTGGTFGTTALRVYTSSGTSAYPTLGSGTTPWLAAEGSASNIPMQVTGKGTSGVQLGNKANTLFVFDGASGYAPVIAARGAAGTPDLGFDMAGYGTYRFTSGGFAKTAFEIYAVNAPDYPTISSGAGVATFGANGASGSVDVYLAPKAGYVRFGTKTSTGDVAVNGYITIKDAAGNLVKLATVA
ncbi:MAG: hypothetical protein KAX46_01500 [Chromatiaceae bacterium]|nr:hypothetical protein [Chromatiaceae bacterium]